MVLVPIIYCDVFSLNLLNKWRFVQEQSFFIIKALSFNVMAANSEITLFVSQRHVKHKSVAILYIYHSLPPERSEDMSA